MVKNLRVSTVLKSLVLLMLLTPILGSTSIAAQQPTLQIAINPAKDGVLLDAEFSYISKVTTTGRYPSWAFSLNYESYYLADRKTFDLGIHIRTSTKYTSVTLYETVKFEIGGYIEGKGDTINVTLKGVVEHPKGEATFYAAMDSELRNYSEAVRAHAKLSMGREIVPQDFIANIQLLEVVLTPQFVNTQLAKQNITWITVRDIALSHSIEDDRFVVELKASAVMDYSELANRLGIDFEYIKRLLEARRSIDIAGEYTILSRHTAQETDFAADIKLSISGDVENYVRAYAKYLASLVTSGLSPEAVESLEPWLELVILPHNTSLKLMSWVDTVGGKAVFEFKLKNLRIGHISLKGDEATKRVAELLVTLFEVAKQSGVPIDYVCNVPGVEPSAELIPLASKVMDLARRGELVPRYMRRYPLPLPPIAFTTTPVQTTAITLVVTAMRTITIQKTVTETITLTETLYRTLSMVETYIKTYTTPITIISTTTVKTTVEVEKIPIAAIGICLSIIAIALALILIRRR